MAYPVYHAATPLAASSNATIKKNKGALLLNNGSGDGTAVIYPTTADGSRGVAMTLRVTDEHSPVVFPVRIHSTGALSKVAVYELS